MVKVYLTDGTPFDVFNPRPCPNCFLPFKARGKNGELHDPCIENLPNVAYACCGHGKKKGYVLFSNRRRFDVPKDLPESVDRGEYIRDMVTEEISSWKKR